MSIDLLQKRRTGPETTVDLLLECHERIRRFTRLAIELTTADASDAQLADAARSLLAYFGRAFPLHAQDEDVSILPRLDATPLVSEVRALSEQHDAMQAALETLLSRWSEVAEDPARRDVVRDALAAETRSFAAMVEPHLATEEETIFPALRELLTPAEDAAIRREMRARRAEAP